MKQWLQLLRAAISPKRVWQGPLVESARSILKPERVLSAKQAAIVWRMEAPPPEKIMLRYTRATLINCATENRTREYMWYLVWLFGFSLRAQRARTGEFRFKSPCFDLEQDWWLDPSENFWANRYFPEGYYLIDLSGKGEDMPHDAQEEKIKALGVVKRARSAMVTESAIGLREDRKTSLLGNWYHVGERDPQGKLVICGKFNGRKGFWIEREDPQNHDPNLRVCL
ncbi:MAG: hypothetical protein FJY98_04095 [Candidatus Liptonbacteria bacterium]|nr:hypothetical protein [Candidatus Liptonbacteria bacterium]